MLIVPLVVGMSIFIYLGILLTLPFDTTTATIWLFTLVGFWSRLPGNAFRDPTWIIYCMDLIDLFTMIIAINVSPLYGAIYTCITNIIPRFCGFWPPFQSVIYDAVAQAITCFIIPFVYHTLGGDIFTSMIMYTVLRLLIIIPFSLVLYPRPFGQWLFEFVTGTFALFFANLFWTKLFGNYFNNLLLKGVEFDWILFLFATAIMLGVYTYFFAKEEKNKSKSNIGKFLVKKLIVKEETMLNNTNSEKEIYELERIKKKLV